MPATLNTERLLLRPWRPEDEVAMVAINEDAEVTRYLNWPVTPAATAAFHAAAVAHWEEHGFGFFAAELREGGRFVGVALAARDDAFARLGLPELTSIVHPENAASRRVAEEVGMAVERQVHNPVLGRDVDVWRLAAPLDV